MRDRARFRLRHRLGEFAACEHARGEILVELRGKEKSLQDKWLDQFFAAEMDSRQARGFKTKLSDIDDQHYFKIKISRADCRIINLDRQNIVKQALSWMRSDELFRRYGHHNANDRCYILPPSRVDSSDLIRRIVALADGRRALTQFVTTSALVTLNIAYEDMLQDPAAIFEQVQRFLGVETLPLYSNLVKSTPDNLGVAIQNFSEVESALRATDYWHMCVDSIVAS